MTMASDNAALRAAVAAICGALPGADVSDPWGGGHEAWKVGGKLFACIFVHLPGVSVKCADIPAAQMLIDAGIARRAPYFHASWVCLPESAADEELRHRLVTSYDLIRARLPKAVRQSLPPRPAGEA